MGLIGANGAGKTTIMKAMLGLNRVRRGTVAIANERVTQLHHAVLAENVGALIEHPAIYPFLTGWQQLQLITKDVTQLQWIVETLQMAAYIHQNAKHYSLGMRQQLGIAMALVRQPKLVVLDEPMNGLDPQAVKRLRQTIRELAQTGMTFFISSHILSELEKVIDDVLVIDHGRVILQTPMQQLRASYHQRLLLQTTDNAHALVWLQQHHYGCALQNDVITVAAPDKLNQLMAGLIAQNIQITRINEPAVDLETILLTQLDQVSGAGQ